MSYTLRLTPSDVLALDWCADRGYVPDELADLGGRALEDVTTDEPVEVPIPEHVAWTLLELRDEDPDAYLACVGSDLRGRLLALEAEVV